MRALLRIGPAFAVLVGLGFVALGVHMWHPHTTGIVGYYEDLENQMFAVYLCMVGVAIVSATVASVATGEPRAPHPRLPRATARPRGR